MDNLKDPKFIVTSLSTILVAIVSLYATKQAWDAETKTAVITIVMTATPLLAAVIMSLLGKNYVDATKAVQLETLRVAEKAVDLESNKLETARLEAIASADPNTLEAIVNLSQYIASDQTPAEPTTTNE